MRLFHRSFLAGFLFALPVASSLAEPRLRIGPVDGVTDSWRSVPNDIELPVGVTVQLEFSWALNLADLNADGRVDLLDYATLSLCFSAPGGRQPRACDAGNYRAADLDADGDVDIHDANALSQAIRTPQPFAVDSVTWSGAHEISRTASRSRAQIDLRELGDHVVRVETTMTDPITQRTTRRSREIIIHVVDSPAAEITADWTRKNTPAARGSANPAVQLFVNAFNPDGKDLNALFAGDQVLFEVGVTVDSSYTPLDTEGPGGNRGLATLVYHVSSPQAVTAGLLLNPMLDAASGFDLNGSPALVSSPFYVPSPTTIQTQYGGGWGFNRSGLLGGGDITTSPGAVLAAGVVAPLTFSADVNPGVPGLQPNAWLDVGAGLYTFPPDDPIAGGLQGGFGQDLSNTDGLVPGDGTWMFQTGVIDTAGWVAQQYNFEITLPVGSVFLYDNLDYSQDIGGGFRKFVPSSEFGNAAFSFTLQADCNENGVPDNEDIQDGTSQDCNANGIPDECDSLADCNANGAQDVCDIAAGTSEDCNSNGVPDECDITAGTSEDCNSNGIPDDCDITGGTSNDCNENAVPDDCEPDCNGSAFPDDCDIASGTSEDCNSNGVPDECEPVEDCNANAVQDFCDVAAGTSEDCNFNGVPDECDIAVGTSEDCNSNSVPDECDVPPDIQFALANLNQNSQDIADLIPDRFDFSGGHTGTCIGDGGADMFDCGNILNTSLQTAIAYTNGVITAGDTAFGPGSEYFTAKYPGLFALVATDVAVIFFRVTGNNGADGRGTTDGFSLSTTFAGETFTIFVRRVYGTRDPSITQIIVVPGDGEGIEHTFATNTDDGTQTVTGLANIDRIYYLLASRRLSNEGVPLSETDAVALVDAFLANVGGTGPDCNGNGIPDECEPDCNGSSVSDDCEITGGTSQDCNANSIPDDCDIAGCPSDLACSDCNMNGVPDGCDIAGGLITQIIDSSGDGAGNTLVRPQGIAVDAVGNAYATGFLSHNAFKITPAGVITEIIDSRGDGAGNRLEIPVGIAADAAGNVFVAGLFSSNAFKITPGGVITQIIDATGDGAGNRLSGALGIAVDAVGNVFVTGKGRSNAFKITPAGVITAIIDATGDGAGNGLNLPNGIAVDPVGNVYVTGEGSDNAFKITSAGFITEIIDATGDGAGNRLEFPVGIAVDAAGNAYVAGFLTHNAFKITPAGVITQIIDATGDGAGNGLDFPVGIAVDAAGNVFVTGRLSDNAFRITPVGAITQIIDATGDGAGNGLDFPVGIAVDAADNVFVTGSSSRNVFKIPTPALPDCNGNDTPDECDIAKGTSRDLNTDGVPDECQSWPMDIKPGSCPNSFNRNSHGVLPVALVGAAAFDVSNVDLSTALLSRADGAGGTVAPHQGPPGPHTVTEDVATPFDGESCECHTLTADGFADLSMKFRTDDVVEALELDTLQAGALVELVVIGTLLDGAEFVTSDCVRLVPPGTGPGMLTVNSNLPQAWIDIAPLDSQLDGGGFGQFDRTWPQSTVVTLSAEEFYRGQRFVGWKFNDEFLSRDMTADLTVIDQSQTIDAVFRRTGDITGDESINLNDFAMFAVCFGKSWGNNGGTGCSNEALASADLDRNGVIDLRDFAIFAIHFGT